MAFNNINLILRTKNIKIKRTSKNSLYELETTKILSYENESYFEIKY